MKFNHIKSDQFMGYFDLGWISFYLALRSFLIEELLHLSGKPVIIVRFNGGPHWSPRNSQPRTPPGPEGSNGSGYAVCRSAAGEGHRHISCVTSPFLIYLCLLVVCGVRYGFELCWFGSLRSGNDWGSACHTKLCHPDRA